MKLIIDIPEDMLEWFKNEEIIDKYDESALKQILKNGIPFDINSETAEVQAYLAGEAYGWEQGRKSLLKDIKAEIEQMPIVLLNGFDHIDRTDTLEIIDKHISGEGDKE